MSVPSARGVSLATARPGGRGGGVHASVRAAAWRAGPSRTPHVDGPPRNATGRRGHVIFVPVLKKIFDLIFKSNQNSFAFTFGAKGREKILLFVWLLIRMSALKNRFMVLAVW